MGMGVVLCVWGWLKETRQVELDKCLNKPVRIGQGDLSKVAMY